VLRCDVKHELSFLDVTEVLAFQNDGSLLLWLSAHYRLVLGTIS